MKFFGGKGKSLTTQPEGRAIAPASRPKLHGEKASFVMPCSIHPPQATEYLLLIVNGTQFVGAKRAAKRVRSGAGGQVDSVPIYSGLSYKNGLDSSCVICGNTTFGGCTVCHTFSCFTEGKPQTCPKCGLRLESPHLGKGTAPLSGAKPAPGRRNADQALSSPSGKRLITDQRK